MSQIDQKQMLHMGTVLDGRYRIVHYLASGGFGNTYVAEDLRLGGLVAVKEFFMRGTNHRSTDNTTVEVSNDTNTPAFNNQLNKFRREARRIYELHNDHIIHVTDLFDANGTSYYVMDLINGTSLAELTRQQPLSEQEARDVALQVLDALKTMHNSGLYHLDVKPGNIMRDSKGHCTLIDFGASKQLTADERGTLSSSTMSYTPGYAPIEQVAQQAKNIGPWTDFYALGATLYKLVTGDPPPEVAASDSAPNGRQFPYPPTLSATMRHAISTLMNPIHELRPQHAEDVRALLEGKNEGHKEETTIFDEGNEETQLDLDDSPDSPKKKMWYIVGGIVALIAIALGILLLTKGCDGKNKKKETRQEITADDEDDEDDEDDNTYDYEEATEAPASPTDSLADIESTLEDLIAEAREDGADWSVDEWKVQYKNAFIAVRPLFLELKELQDKIEEDPSKADEFIKDSQDLEEKYKRIEELMNEFDSIAKETENGNIVNEDEEFSKQVMEELGLGDL